MKNLISRACLKALKTIHGHEWQPKNDGFELIEEGAYGSTVTPYVERPEFGTVNISAKIERAANGGPFEWPDIVNLNNAVASMIEDEKRILELGAGTAKFSSLACADPSRSVVASEYDRDTHLWCVERFGDIENLELTNDKIELDDGPFDLVVSIDVVEHVKEYVDFLRLIQGLSCRAIITTPNRRRLSERGSMGPPSYEQHVREWSAGEFYWVMRCFWGEVNLFTTLSDSEPQIVPIGVNSKLSPLIADCRHPLNVK